MEEQIVKCPDCGNILYTVGKTCYIVGTIMIRHGFSGQCFCGYVFNSDWIKKEDAK